MGRYIEVFYVEVLIKCLEFVIVSTLLIPIKENEMSITDATVSDQTSYGVGCSWMWNIVVIVVKAITGVAILFAIAMLLAGFVLMIPSCTGKFAHGFVMASPFWGAFIYGVVLLFVWGIFEYVGNRIAFVKRYELVFLMLLSLIVHIILIKVIPTLVQIKDLLTYDPLLVLKSMESGRICFMHSARNVGWCNYEILMSMLAILFSGTLEFGRIVQAVLCAITLVPVFYISQWVAGRRFARFTTILLVFSPTIVLYSMVLTSEYLSALLMCLSAYFIFAAIRARDFGFNNVCLMVLGGVALGVSDIFKVIAIVFIIAFVLILVILISYEYSRMAFLRMVMTGAVVLSSFIFSRYVGQSVLNELAGKSELKTGQEKLSSGLLYELALGLNIEREGFWDSKLASDFLKMPPERQRAFVSEAIRRGWKDYPMLMVRKFRNIHGSANYYHGAISTFVYSFKGKDGKWHVPKWVSSLPDYGTTYFKVAFLLGAIGLFISVRRRCITFWLLGLFSVFIVLGFAVVEQLIEGHGRYKTSIYPFYFMVLPYICVWFERDNPVYVRLARWAGLLMSKLKRTGNER